MIHYGSSFSFENMKHFSQFYKAIMIQKRATDVRNLIKKRATVVQNLIKKRATCKFIFYNISESRDFLWKENITNILKIG